MSYQDKFRARLYIAQVLDYVRGIMATALLQPDPDAAMHEARATLMEARGVWKALR